MSDAVILVMVDKVEKYMPRSPMMQKLMRPVLVDIAVALFRGDEPSAKRMGLDQHLLDAIVNIMRSP